MHTSLNKSIIDAATRILTRDSQASLYESFMLTEDRIDFLKEKNPTIDTSHDSLATHKDASAIIDHIATEGDPTSKKIHTQWILGQYKKQNIRQEDLPRVHTALSNFEKYKGKLAQKDINQYPHINDVEDAVQPHIGTASSKKEEVRQIKDEGAELVHSENGLTVHKMKTKEAACKYGAGTKWCTAADQNNMFDHYHKNGPLYVVQKNGEKHQFHFESNQFMDSSDRAINVGKFVDQNPELRNVPEFKDKHIAFLEPHEREAAMREYKNPDMVRRAINADTPVPPEVHHSIATKAIAASAATPLSEKNPHTSVLNSLTNPENGVKGGTLDLIAKAGSDHHSIARHPNIQSETAMHILSNADSKSINLFKHHLTTNPGVQGDVLSHIHATTPAGNIIHENIAAHANTPAHILGSYAGGDNFISRHAALKNPRINPADVANHANDPRDHAAVSMSPAASEDTLRSVFNQNKNNDWIHANLAQNKRTPKDVLETLTTHPDADIAKKATKTLKGKK